MVKVVIKDNEKVVTGSVNCVRVVSPNNYCECQNSGQTRFNLINSVSMKEQPYYNVCQTNGSTVSFVSRLVSEIIENICKSVSSILKPRSSVEQFTRNISTFNYDLKFQNSYTPSLVVILC